jgi:4-amino-4-deoxy-L-arabinose transferase-like glycosyltransferase
MQAAHYRKLACWGMFCLLLLAFASRVFTLTNQSLWRDEVDALRFATAPWQEVLNTFTRPGWNGPLYFFLLRGWIGLTGSSEFALRYFSLLLGVAAVALAFVLARRLARTATAFLCATFFAASPYFIWYSQEVKMYTLILACATLAIYALRRAVQTNRPLWWITFVIATTITFYSHILAALLIPVEMILTLTWGIGVRRRWWWIGALASFACLTLPYLPLMLWQLPLIFQPAQTGYSFYPFDQMLIVTLNGFAAGISGKLPDFTLWLVGLPMLIGAFLSEAAWRDKAALLAWLLLPPLALYLVSLNRPIFTDRYLIWIGPAFYLLVALGAVALGQLWKPLGLVTTLAVIGIAATGAYFQAATPIKSDLRGAARYFEAHHAQGDLVIFQIPYVRYTFEYYYRQPYEWADGPFTNYGMSDAQVDEQMRPIVAGCKTVWLVASEMEMWDSKLQVWKWLEAHGRRTEEKVFAQVILYRYEF